MNSEKNLRLVQDIYAAFVRGDIGFVIEQIADDCGDFSVISGSPTLVPWHLNGSGKKQAIAFFEALGGAVEFESFEPRDYASAGDNVYATLGMVMRSRETGEKFKLAEVIHHFTVKNGKVTRWRASEDTAETSAVFSKSSAQNALVKQAQHFMDELKSVWKTNDGSSLGKLFTEDGTLINPFGQRADGRASVAAMYTEYFGTILKNTTTRIDLGKVHPVGSDHAFVDAEQTILGASGEVVMAVHLSALLRREGLRWKFVDCRPFGYAPKPA